MTAARPDGHPCAVDLHRATDRAASRPALPSKLRRVAPLIAALAGNGRLSTVEVASGGIGLHAVHRSAQRGRDGVQRRRLRVS